MIKYAIFYLILIFACLSSAVSAQSYLKQPETTSLKDQLRDGYRISVLASRGNWDLFVTNGDVKGAMLLMRKTKVSTTYILLECDNILNGKISGNGRILVTSDKKFVFDLYSKSAVFDKDRFAAESDQDDPRIIAVSYGRFFQGSLIMGVYRDKEIRMEGLFSDWGGIHFGKISYAKHDTVWTGFVDQSLIGANSNKDYYGTAGLRTKSYGDQMKILPFVKSAPYDNLKSLPESDYKPDRTFVSNLKWNNGVYEGEVINGVPEGFGFWYHNFNGSAEIGYYKSGYPHGLMARRSPGPTLNSFGVTGLAVFNNGIASKGVCSTYRGFYEGEVTNQITPAGKGKMSNIVMDGENVMEEGEFSGNVLNGLGKRTRANGSYESGTFQNGIFTSGFVKVTLPGLRVGDVIRVNGNKKLVRQTGLFEGSSRYVVLNDWSKLYETQKFEISFESDSEFYSPCSRCNGTGTLTEQRTSYTWIRNEYSESTKVDQAYGTITKTYTTTPKYSTRTSTINHSCGMCKGYGRLMK